MDAEAVATVKLAATGGVTALLIVTVCEPVERVLLFEVVELFDCISVASPAFFDPPRNRSFSSSNSELFLHREKMAHKYHLQCLLAVGISDLLSTQSSKRPLRFHL